MQRERLRGHERSMQLTATGTALSHSRSHSRSHSQVELMGPLGWGNLKRPTLNSSNTLKALACAYCASR